VSPGELRRHRWAGFPPRALNRQRSARTLAAGHAFVQNLRRGHYDIATDTPAATGCASLSTTWHSPSDQRSRDRSCSCVCKDGPTQQCRLAQVHETGRTYRVAKRCLRGWTLVDAAHVARTAGPFVFRPPIRRRDQESARLLHVVGSCAGEFPCHQAEKDMHAIQQVGNAKGENRTP
jgi:hypothetical protein